MAKEVLTPEEVAAKKVRRSNGWTRFWAIVLALVLVGGSTVFAKTQADKANEETAKKQAELASQRAESVNNTVGGGSQSFDGAGDSASAGDDAAAPASSEAEDAVKAINAATAEAANAGYDWVRTSKYTQPINVGNATDTLNKVIHMVDKNANLDSVVGGFIGIGEKSATVAKGGKPAAEQIGYHGESYQLKATKLQASDLKDLKVDGKTYTFSLADVTTLKKDGSTGLNRLTDDIVTQEEIDAEIQAQVSVVTVNNLNGKYSNIKVTVVLTEDGKLEKMTYAYDATVNELALKALGIPITGTGAMHTEATYSNFVY